MTGELNMTAHLLRRAATQIRVDTKVRYERGHVSTRELRFLSAVADLLDNTAGHVQYSGATESSEDVRDALNVARAYLGEHT